VCALSKTRVLVVDDNTIWRTTIVELLRREGLKTIEVAYDGVQAVFKARALMPDLVLMDVSLPHKNGIDAAAEIHEAVPSAKIIFVSCAAEPGIKQAALKAGGSDFVCKSQVGSQLIDAIKLVLGDTETA
jgi:two-component system, chemotaxis family, chemotaxis protein CheY